MTTITNVQVAQIRHTRKWPYLAIISIPKQMLFWQMNWQEKSRITNKKHWSKLKKENRGIPIPWSGIALWCFYPPQISSCNQRTLQSMSSTVICWCKIHSSLHLDTWHYNLKNKKDWRYLRVHVSMYIDEKKHSQFTSS